MTSVHEKEMNIKELERSMYEIGCEIAAGLMRKYLESLDKELSETRDKKRYRHKGIRKTTIKTLMGEVEISRRIYQVANEEGTIEHRYLLDETIGMKVIGNISANLAERIAKEITHTSYRSVAESISQLTNQRISHSGVWNIVQEIGQREKESERKLVSAHKREQLHGTRAVNLLFEETDGVWISLQGKSRPQRGKGKKELKIGCSYEGWQPRYSGSTEYQTVNKHSVAGMMNSQEFHAVKEAKLAQIYNLDEISNRILNGDGANWIKQVHDIDDTLHYQLDPYHLSRAVTQNVSNKQAAFHIRNWLKGGQSNKALEKIQALKYEGNGLISEIKKLQTLEKYIRNQQAYLIPYQNRPELTLPAPPEGMSYRSLGTMESQVAGYAARMKGGRSWSEQGADHLAKILALKNSPHFLQKVSQLLNGKLSQDMSEQIIVYVHQTRRTVKQHLPAVRQGGRPFTGQSRTNGRKAIQQYFDLRSFTDLIYR
jgi:hypothetical protein